MGQTREALYMTHSQGQKVKGQGHKVMRRSSTKTSNISHKRHSVVERHRIYLIGNRGRRSEWRAQIFDRSSYIAVSAHAR